MEMARMELSNRALLRKLKKAVAKEVKDPLMNASRLVKLATTKLFRIKC